MQYTGILRQTGQNGKFIGFNMSRSPILSDLRCSMMSDFSHLLLVLNSSVNIVIYGWKDSKFRELLLKLLNLQSCFKKSSPLLGREMTEVSCVGMTDNDRNSVKNRNSESCL